MRRRSLIALILLLFTTGAAVFYFQLRKNAVPEFSQVDQFLRQAPVSGNWELVRTDEGVVTVATGGRWLSAIGIKRIRNLPRHHYEFSDPRGTASAQARVTVFVTHDSQRITHLMVHGKPADARIFLRDLLEKFPRLQSFGSYSAGCPF